VTLEEEYELLAPIPQLTDTAEPLSMTAASLEPAEVISDDQVARALHIAAEAEQSGNIQSAIVRYGDVIDLDPLNFDARLGRGRCLMEMADYAAAMSDLQRAEDLSPESAQAPFEMGNLFYARKDYRRAITFYTQAINSDPELVFARVRRGMSYFYRRDHDKALADLERAQNLQPNMPGLSASINKVTRAMHR
jgi:tetratricopeptide (TPR) repeat protein